MAWTSVSCRGRPARAPGGGAAGHLPVQRQRGRQPAPRCPDQRPELLQSCHELGLDPLLRRLPDGLATELRERGGNLSSGERQLLAVARVAIRNPSVLVMDEATAFMDPATEATLQRDLERLLIAAPPS
jgi:ABC-type multidrug transport system fused ATPase/permease subunit